MSRREVLHEISVIIVGAVLFAMAMNMFLLPARIVLGGMTGIGVVVNLFFGAPVGVTIILLNIPLILLNVRRFGRGFLVRTLIGVAATSAATDLIRIFPVTITDPLICAVFGGITIGAATGFLLARGYTTGGTDLIACLIKPIFPSLSAGSVIMAADLAIIFGAAILTREFSGIFYSLICSIAAGRATDLTLSGARRAAQALIISDKTGMIASAIIEELDRSATILEGVGGYSGEVKRMTLCVVSKRQLHRLRRLIARIDPRAFVILSDAAEVSGEGFKNRAAGDI